MTTFELRIEVTLEPASPEEGIGVYATDAEGQWFLVDTWHTMAERSKALAIEEAMGFVSDWLNATRHASVS